MRDSRSHTTKQVSHLSRDILILSRDKKIVACPLWATVHIKGIFWFYDIREDLSHQSLS